MAWSGSKVSMAFLEDVFENTTAMDMNSDTLKFALYDNDITPSQTAAAASFAFNAGQWATAGNEVADGAEWPTGGVALTSVTSGSASNVYTLDSADVVSPGTSATLTNVFGGLLYDDTITTPVADQGISYHYFGGANSVTDGTFTAIVNASGWWALTA